ncbi:hypothetical protein K7432_016981, partial [Basidiobolus ranarum]
MLFDELKANYLKVVATVGNSDYTHLSSYSNPQLFLMWLTVAWWSFMVILSILGYLICRFRYARPRPSLSATLPPREAQGGSVLRPIK